MKEKQIQPGTIMQVTKVDKDGDIAVMGKNWEREEWILQRNFMKLEKITVKLFLIFVCLCSKEFCS